MKSIIITGASSGLGALTAHTFLQNGWRVGLVARSEEKLKAVANGSQNAVLLPCDVSNEDQVAGAFKQFEGNIDVLFNNAGSFGAAGLIDEISLSEWQRVVDVNLTGMFLSARAAFGRMRKQSPQGGRIINNGSISATTPRPGSISYTSTKHAISGMTKTLALDGRPFGISCGQIDIGNAASAMTERMSGGVPQADGSVRPEPVMDAKHVSNTVFHMASLPPEANILNVTVMASDMPFVGRG